VLAPLLKMPGARAPRLPGQPAGERAADERLSFQTAGPWSPRVNLDADWRWCTGSGAASRDDETWRGAGTSSTS